jgi:dipeptidase E
MRLLLTSAGIKNPSIHDALVDLLGKPIGECSALCIPTATYASGRFDLAWRFINGQASTPMCELGWKSLPRETGNCLPTNSETLIGFAHE